MLSAAELEARRWDGYRGILAPRLRGEGAWPGASLGAGYEARVAGALDAAVARVPFWLQARAALLCMHMASCALGLPSKCTVGCSMLCSWCIIGAAGNHCRPLRSAVHAQTCAVVRRVHNS